MSEKEHFQIKGKGSAEFKAKVYHARGDSTSASFREDDTGARTIIMTIQDGSMSTVEMRLTREMAFCMKAALSYLEPEIYEER